METIQHQRLQDCKRALSQKKELIAELAQQLMIPKSILLKLDVVFESISHIITSVLEVFRSILQERIAEMDHTKYLKVLLRKLQSQLAETNLELDKKESLKLEECQHFMNRAAQLKYQIKSLDKASQKRNIDIQFDQKKIKESIQQALTIKTGVEVIDMKNEEEKQEMCLIQPVQNAAQLVLYYLGDEGKKITLASPLVFPRQFAIEQLGSRVYVAGGRNKGFATNKFFSVNGKLEFEHYQSLEIKCAYSALLKLKGSQALLLSGGISNSKVMKYCAQFELQRKKWKGFPLLNKARCCHTCACAQNITPYVFAGWVGESQKIESVEKYIKQTSSWVELKLETRLGRRDDLFSFSYLNGIYIFGDGKKTLDNFYFSTQTDTLGKGKVKCGAVGSSECRTRMLGPKGKAFYVSDDYELFELTLK